MDEMRAQRDAALQRYVEVTVTTILLLCFRVEISNINQLCLRVDTVGNGEERSNAAKNIC